jgi:hypothetical protein
MSPDPDSAARSTLSIPWPSVSSPRLAPAIALAALASLAAVACGGQDPPPVAPTAATTPPPASAPAPATPAPAPIAAAPSPAAAADENYDEFGDPTNLAPLFEKGASPSFPKATTSEHDCWQTVSVSGAARKDYETITAKCGPATGSVEYVKPTMGKLHAKHDKRDTFIVPIHGGLCYRFFGVADSSIADLDILIEKKGGALVGDDKTVGPVAIIESDKAWCIDTDGVYNFLVEIDGEGQGNYVFGIWARKK